MNNTSKVVRLLTILSLSLFILELSTTKAMPVNEATADDRELRSALESFLQDSSQTDNSTQTIPHSNMNTTTNNSSSNSNSTSNRVLSDELVDDLDLDTSGSADDSDHENDEGDYFLKPNLDASHSTSLKENTTTNNQTILDSDAASSIKHKSPSNAKRPDVAQSGPVDNTDLSLEQPDLPNHENVIIKEVHSNESSLKLSETNHSTVDHKSDFSTNKTQGKEDDDGLGYTDVNNSSQLPTEVEDAFTILQQNGSNSVISNTSLPDASNRTVTSKKKLLYFLDASENYTKGAHNFTHDSKNISTTNGTSSKFHDSQPETMENSSVSNSSTPENTTKLDSDNDDEIDVQAEITDLKPTGTTSVFQPIQYLPTGTVSPMTGKLKAQVNLAPVNVIRNPYINYQTGQTGIAMNPNRALTSNQALYNRLYQNSQWTNMYGLQMVGRQSPVQVQRYQGYPSYYGYHTRFLGQPVRTTYSNDIYQRSRVEYPNTLLDSTGQRPKISKGFEDALFESGQNYPGRDFNDFLTRSTVKSLQPNSEMRSGLSGQSTFGQNTRFYTNRQNNLLDAKSAAVPLGGRQQQGNMSKKQAYNVYQAAIYLADLLKNESLKLDEISSGHLRNDDKDDDLTGGESDKGSGDSIILDQPETPVQSTLLSNNQLDKLIQEEDLGLNSQSDSETSGISPNKVPDFKSSSNEEPDAIFSPNDNSKNQELSDVSSMENDTKEQEKGGKAEKTALGEPEVAANKILPKQENKPAVQENAVAADSAAAVKQEAVVNTVSQADEVQAQTPKDKATQQSQIMNSDSTAEAAAAQPEAAVNTPLDQSQTFSTNSAEQPEVPVNTPLDQSQSFSQTMTQQEAQPAVNAYSAAAAQPDDALATATQQTFNDADLSASQADYQSAATSAFNAQQPAETTNSAAATQQWDTTASATPQESQQYNDAAASSQQAVQPSNTNSYATEGRSHTIQLDEEKYRTLICQSGKDTISCPPNQQISIQKASYGSMGASACLGRQSFTPSQFCKTSGAYEIVKSNCDDMEDCELMANDDIFGDECQTDKKYLDVEYNCVPSQSFLGPRFQWQKLFQYHSNPQKFTEFFDKPEPKTKLRKPASNSEPRFFQRPGWLFADPFMQRSYAPASPYQGGFPPQAMYPAQQPASSQYMYPGAQPAVPAYAPSPYQGYPTQQGYEQEQQPLAPSPPAPKLPELMSTLVAMSKKNQASTQQQCTTQCSTCSQCAAMPVCNPCPVCQSTACTATPSVPYIPKGLRPLWELWNEKTADMNRMEMSALIISPVPKLPPTKKSSSLTEKSEGSGDENSDKRSHVKSSKKTAKKVHETTKKTNDASKHSAKLVKVSKKSKKTGSKAKH